MNKVDDYEAVQFAVHELTTYKNMLNESEILGSIDYVNYQLFSRRMQFSEYFHTELQNILSSFNITDSGSHNVSINVENVFSININGYYEIQIHPTSEIYYKIRELQQTNKLSRYTKIDKHMTFGRSNVFFIPMYNKCVELVCKSEIKSEDILSFIKDVYNNLLEYVPIFKDLDAWVEQHPMIKPSVCESGDILDIDYSKYDIECDHTALKTGEWNE